MYGNEGQGMSARYINMIQSIDIIQGTLGKAFGAIGGYIAGKNEVIDTIRSMRLCFILQLLLPPCITAAAIANIRHLRKNGC